MKTLLSALAITTAITAPTMVAAKPVKFSITLKRYWGPRAYMAVYLTDSSGAFKGTLWVAGSYSRYYRHLGGWLRAARGNPGRLRGITGASVGAGRTLTFTADLADALFDAGYKLHVDAAVENYRESPSDVVVPLSRANAGKAVRGRRFITKFTFN